jgi:hypothetical protein
LVPIHVGRAPELVFMFLRTEKSVATGGIWTPDRTARTPITMLITLFQLRSNTTKHWEVWSNITQHSTWHVTLSSKLFTVTKLSSIPIAELMEEQQKQKLTSEFMLWAQIVLSMHFSLQSINTVYSRI